MNSQCKNSDFFPHFVPPVWPWLAEWKISNKMAENVRIFASAIQGIKSLKEFNQCSAKLCNSCKPKKHRFQIVWIGTFCQLTRPSFLQACSYPRDWRLSWVPRTTLLKPLHHHRQYITEGFKGRSSEPRGLRGTINWAPIIPRGVSLSYSR